MTHPAPESCRHCLWDIARDSDGRWRLAWGGSDEPYACEGWTEGHEPQRRDTQVDSRFREQLAASMDRYDELLRRLADS